MLLAPGVSRLLESVYHNVLMIDSSQLLSRPIIHTPQKNVEIGAVPSVDDFPCLVEHPRSKNPAYCHAFA
jgi:hypothetical protein